MGAEPSQSIANLIERFCASLITRGRSPITIKNYRSDLQGFLRWSEGRGRKVFAVHSVTSEKLVEYKEGLKQHYKDATIYRKLSVLKVFFQWAADSGYLRSGQSVRVPGSQVSTSRRIPKCLSREQQGRLRHSVTSGGIARDIAAIALLLDAGLRVSELCELRWKDVLGESGSLRLSSRRAERREIPLSGEVCKSLLRLKESHHGVQETVFSRPEGPITRRTVEKMLARYSAAAGLNGLTPHDLRDSFCANLAASGVTPQTIEKLTGLDCSTVLSSYYAPVSEDLKQVIESMDFVLKSNKYDY
jgi:integrase/recombinase XerC